MTNYYVTFVLFVDVYTMAQNVQEVPCDICDTTDDVNSFCANCKQNFCDGCKKGHLRTASSKHHKFLSIGDSLVASSHVSDICTDHKEQKQFYCRTCSKTACPECLAKHHQKHEFSVVNTFAASIRQDIIDKLSEKEREIDTLSHTIGTCPSEIETFKFESRQVKAAITTSIKGWIDDLKSFEEELHQNIEDATTEGIMRLEKKAGELESNKVKNLQFVFDIQAKLRTCSDVALIEQSSEILEQINEIQVLSSSLAKSKLPAVPLRSSHVNDVKKMLGFPDNKTHQVASSNQRKVELQRSDKGMQNKGTCNRNMDEVKPTLSDKLTALMKFMMTHKSKVEYVYGIATLPASKAWIATSFSIKLVSDTGKVLVSSNAVRKHGTSVAAMPNGDALYAASDTVIKRINQTGNVTVFHDIKPDVINDIAKSNVRDIVYVATAKNILKLSYDAQIVDRINQEAVALTELSNGDIITVTVDGDMVVHRPNKSNHVFCNLLRLESVPNNRFTTSLTSDKHGRIIRANSNGKDVYVFDMYNDVVFLHCTYTVDIRLKYGVGILSVHVDDKNRLWIGTASGDVLIARYTE